MIEHTLPTGSGGNLKIIDNTDDPNLMTVEYQIYYAFMLDVPQLPWTYSIDGVMESWKSMAFAGGTAWQPLGGAYVGNAATTTLHLGDTGTTELGGPTDFTINLYGHVPEGGLGDAVVSVKMGEIFKKAVPYVNDNGVWKIAKPYVKTPTGWNEVG